MSRDRNLSKTKGGKKIFQTKMASFEENYLCGESLEVFFNFLDEDISEILDEDILDKHFDEIITEETDEVSKFPSCVQSYKKSLMYTFFCVAVNIRNILLYILLLLILCILFDLFTSPVVYSFFYILYW